MSYVYRFESSLAAVKTKDSSGFQATVLLLISMTTLRNGVEPRMSYRIMLRSDAVLASRWV